LLPLRDRGMPVSSMQEHLAFPRSHKVVLLIGNVNTVTVHFVQPVLIGKIVQPENIALVYRLHCARMQVRVELSGLHNTGTKSLDHSSRSDRPRDANGVLIPLRLDQFDLRRTNHRSLARPGEDVSRWLRWV